MQTPPSVAALLLLATSAWAQPLTTGQPLTGCQTCCARLPPRCTRSARASVAKVGIKKNMPACITTRAHHLHLCCSPSFAHRLLTLLPPHRTARAGSPGGSCDKASHGKPGICCGQVNGVGPGYCCAADQKCTPCRNEYRCYSGIRPPPDTCANSGGGFSVGGHRRDGFGTSEEVVSSAVGLIGVLALFYVLFNCLRRSVPPPFQQQGFAMQPVPVSAASMGVGGGVVPVGKPIPVGQAGSMPVASACAMPACTGAYQGGPTYPAAYPAAYPHASMGHPMHPGYGYGGGTVAMGAGMGFLGGMMMGEALSDHGHHGGGDYGGGDYGGGDYGGGGGDFGGSCAADM